MKGLHGASDGMMPDGSIAHDSALIARLANDLFRDAYALASDRQDPGRLSELNGLGGGPDTSWHRNQLLRSELRYRAEGGEGLPVRMPWPESQSQPAEVISAQSVADLRKSFDAGDETSGFRLVHYPAEPGAAHVPDYYFLAPPEAVPSEPGPRPDVAARSAAPPVSVRDRAHHTGTERSGHLSSGGFDPFLVRNDFPALNQKVHGRPLVWLDNAATTQKPQSVIDAVSQFYEHDNSNVHRGAHELAARATDAYEGGRERVRAFVGATSTREVIFVRGTTEAINLVAQSYGRQNVEAGDEVIVTELEHHSNIVPWQLLCREKGAHLRVVPIDDRGEVCLDEYARLLGPRTRIVAVSQVSNALGTVVPVEIMTQMAHAEGAVVVVDGAQGIPHLPVNVQALGADFYAFSGHKLYGPTGVGVLWGREELLEAMPPWQGGGQMIKTVDFSDSTFNDLPYKFEAGTGILAGAVGLGAAIDYVCALGVPAIAAHEHALLEYGMAGLQSIPGLRMIGTAPGKAAVLGFVIDGVDVESVGSDLDVEGIAVRAGHHCAQPALRHFGLEATVRPSLGLYNTHDDLDRLVEAVWKVASRRRRT